MVVVAAAVALVAAAAWLVGHDDPGRAPQAAARADSSELAASDPRGPELVAAARSEQASSAMVSQRSEAPVTSRARRTARASESSLTILRGTVDLGGSRDTRGLWVRLRRPDRRKPYGSAEDLHAALRGPKRVREHVPVEAGCFELAAEPGTHVVEVFALGGAEPVWASPPIDATLRSGERDLDGIDLRGRVHLVSFTVVDEHDRSQLRGATADLPGGYPLEPGRRYVSAVPELVVSVGAPGYLGALRRVGAGAPVVALTRAPRIELVLDPALESPPEGASLRFELRLVRSLHGSSGPAARGPEWTRVDLEGRSARFSLEIEGEYEVRVHARHLRGARQSAATLPCPVNVTLERTRSRQPVTVTPLEAAYSSWIGSLR